MINPINVSYNIIADHHNNWYFRVGYLRIAVIKFKAGNLLPYTVISICDPLEYRSVKSFKTLDEAKEHCTKIGDYFIKVISGLNT